jgi:hypothetical protein
MRIISTILLFVLFVFVSCRKEENRLPQNSAKRTVIVYMAADNNLWDVALEDIEEMKKGLFMFS